MNLSVSSRALAVVALAASLAALPAAAQQVKVVSGLVVNMGITSALDAEHVDAQHGVHKGGHGSGMEHVIVSLAQDKDGTRVADADVTIEVKSPKGDVQKKPAAKPVEAVFTVRRAY